MGKYEHFYSSMNSYQSCWASCSGCGGCGGIDPDDMEELFSSLCSENCSGDCDCDGECDGCDCKKDDRPNSEKVRDDGCFCRKCGDFVPMAEPDVTDGKCTCWGCEHGY